MKNAWLGAFLGLLVGATLGGLLALIFHWTEPGQQPETGWTNYPTLTSATGPLLWQQFGGRLSLHSLLFQGILFGGGFGSLMGAISAAAGAIIRSLEGTKPR
jgi:heme/copper-type cytochrome/quinol oxidase subunit 1